MRIVVADDDPVNRLMLQSCLAKWGHEVILTGDGESALAALRAEGRPSVVIVDWMMPGLTGPEVCARIRRDPAITGSYVILLTAKGEREDMVAALAEGADDFITKPFDRDVLRARIGVGERILTLQGELAHSNRRLHEHADRLEATVQERTADLVKAHRELREADRIKERILTSIHHELRTPITKLLLTGQALERMRPGTVPAPAMLASLVKQAKHMAALLDQVISARALVSSDERDGEAHGPGADMGRTLQGIVETLRDAATARRVRVELAPVPAGLRAVADQPAVQVIVSPILDNALKFTRPGTDVRVSCEAAAGGRLRIAVTDQGPGIRGEDVERVFSEFEQGSGDILTGKPAGLGLGLAIARRLAQRLGGDVVLAQPPAGGGSTFWIELPAAA